MDSKIIIWRNFESYRVLELDTPVKGISFDPLGEFLASQSDDQKVIIWNITTWKKQHVHDFQAAKNAGPFFQRLSWSPDGEHLATANVMNGTSPVIYLIDRSSFNPKTALAGHSDGIEISLFNPRIFTKGDAKKPILYVALGSQDSAVSIWTTTSTRPISTIEKAFFRRAHDLSWSADGYVLGACSSDGTVIFIHFSEEDLGTTIALSDCTDKPSAKRIQTIASSAQQLHMENSARPVIAKPKVGVVSVTPVAAQAVITKNGRKKIAPVNFGVGQQAFAASKATSLVDGKFTQPAAVKPSPKEDTRARDELTAFHIKDSPLPMTKKPCHKVRRQIPCPPITPYLGHRTVAFDRPTALKKLVKANVGDAALVVECDNTPRSSIKYFILKCTQGEKELWKDILGSPATIIECHLRFIAVACDNGDLLTYSMTGSKVLPILRIDGQIAFLRARDSYLLCISSSGLLYLWDLEEKHSVVAAVSVTPLLDAVQPPPIITSACIVQGRALVSLDNSRSYMFDPTTMAWILVRSPLLALSEFQPSPEDLEADNLTWFTSGLPDGLENILLQSSSIEHSAQRIISLSQLEHQVAAAQVLKMPESYRSCLIKLVYRLTDDGLEERLREICQSLLGPLVPTETSTHIMGIDRHKLLHEILCIMASNRSIQHLTSEYQGALAQSKH
ncbi:HIR complex subunit [Entomophthora muscae]|uniref:HIR complex subunit n=1 Tax=Entomophthora muscae TaxID=34485 RepID=A0ACC2TP32_9FUNG|nr:HIR complex subunit [Entomophthora muscae]